MLIFIGFTTQIARLVEWMFPDRPITPDQALMPKYLDKLLRSTACRQSGELMQLADTANDLEHIGDRIVTGMVTSANKRIDEDFNVSAETAEILTA